MWLIHVAKSKRCLKKDNERRLWRKVRRLEIWQLAERELRCAFYLWSGLLIERRNFLTEKLGVEWVKGLPSRYTWVTMWFKLLKREARIDAQQNKKHDSMRIRTHLLPRIRVIWEKQRTRQWASVCRCTRTRTMWFSLLHAFVNIIIESHSCKKNQNSSGTHASF